MEMGSSSSSNHDSFTGLKFGKKIYFEDGAASTGGGTTGEKNSTKPPPIPPPPPPAIAVAAAVAPVKKGKGVGPTGQQQTPRCQVEGCNEDLTGSKAYYCRHKVCAMHSKAPRVIVSGIEQRFCQQCSRFHQLPEFDQGKRSCRRRLAGHNERRRKPPPGPLSSRYARLASSFHESGRFRSFLLDFSYPRVGATARDTWPSYSRSGTDRMASNHWQGGSVDPHFTTVTAHGSHPAYMQHEPLMSGGALTGAPDSSCALSLLSTQPWTNSTSRNRSPTEFGLHNNNDYATGPWNFRGHESGGASSNGRNGFLHHAPPNEIGIGDVAPTNEFSGELELALQRNGPHQMDHGSGSGFGHSGHVSHWSL